MFPAALLDKPVIFLCCLLVYFSQSTFPVNVVAVLTAVIIACLFSYVDDERIHAAIVGIFIFLASFFPELVVFLPVILFDFLYCRYRLIVFLALIPWLHFASLVSRQMIVGSLMLLGLAALMRIRAEELTELQTKYFKLSDEAREMSLRLQKQNRDLMEKQDTQTRLATLNERSRIAREIHDNVGHLLSSAILQVGALLTINRDEKIKQHLEVLQTTLSEAMDSTRKSVHALYEESLDLKLQIEKLVRNFTFCPLYYEYGFVSNPPQNLKYAFIAIIKEALANLIKHSNATRAEVILREHPALFQLIIRDNGTVKNYHPDAGLGLKNMTERVQALNGIINIFTADGFEIFISIPKEGMKFEGTGN